MMSLFPAQFTKKAGQGGPTRWSEEEIQVALEGTCLCGVHAKQICWTTKL